MYSAVSAVGDAATEKQREKCLLQDMML